MASTAPQAGAQPDRNYAKSITRQREARSRTLRQRQDDLRQKLLAEIAAIDIGGRVMKPKELAKHRAEVCMKLGFKDRLVGEEFA